MAWGPRAGSARSRRDRARRIVSALQMEMDMISSRHVSTGVPSLESRAWSARERRPLSRSPPGPDPGDDECGGGQLARSPPRRPDRVGGPLKRRGRRQRERRIVTSMGSMTDARNPVIACVDVADDGARAVAACIVAAGWTAEAPIETHVTRLERVREYVPGRFFERELPCISRVLSRVGEPLDVVVVDGYVWLDGRGRRGLGAHLFDSLGGGCAVVGVAKTPFRRDDGPGGAGAALEVLRGSSARPLYVTAIGMDAAEAAARVRSMHRRRAGTPDA